MLGIVACEALYAELPTDDPSVAVEFVPQWYHEYPIHAPESETIHDLVQEGIDRLEARGVDAILVLYHDEEGMAGLQTAETPLHVFYGDDCIDIFLTANSRNRFGDRKATGTYYLTRGWIDVGLDAYKVYRAYAGTLDELAAQFRAAQTDNSGMRISWLDADRIAHAAERSEQMRSDPASLLRDVVSCYSQIRLIDTGTLLPFHHTYAEQFREFVSDVGSVNGSMDVSLQVSSGDRSLLANLLTEPTAVPDVETYPPGTPVPDRPAPWAEPETDS